MFEEWKKLKHPLEMYRYTIKILRKGMNCLGLDVINPNFKINIICISLVCYVTSFFMRVIWCVYEVKHSFADIILTLTTLGYALQGVSKLVTTLKNHKTIYMLFNFNEYIYKVNRNNDKVKHVLKYHATVALIVMCITALFYICGLLLFGTFPLYSLVIQNEYVLLHHIKFPGFSPDTLYGYIYNSIFQIIDTVLGTLGNYCADCIFFILINYSICMMGVIKCIFNELDYAISHGASERELHKFILNIIRLHQDYEQYKITLNTLFDVIIFVQISASGFFMAFTLFGIMIVRNL